MNTIVLLSGGLDSTALLWRVKAACQEEVRALCFHYGQPNSDAERAYAQRAARLAGVPFDCMWIPEAVGRGGITKSIESAGNDKTGSKSIVPIRNAVLIACAVSHGLAWWNDHFDVAIGCNLADAAGFSDCRSRFLDEISHALSAASGKHLRVLAPYLYKTKAQILEDAQATGCLDVVLESWSCYRETKGAPCGDCHACDARAKAVAAAGVTDRSAWPTITGGDPSRERA